MNLTFFFFLNSQMNLLIKLNIRCVCFYELLWYEDTEICKFSSLFLSNTGQSDRNKFLRSCINLKFSSNSLISFEVNLNFSYQLNLNWTFWKNELNLSSWWTWHICTWNGLREVFEKKFRGVSVHVIVVTASSKCWQKNGIKFSLLFLP